MAKAILYHLYALLLCGTLSLSAEGAIEPGARVKSDTQMGFYDLMSLEQEIYNSHMEVVNNTILTTITSQEDPGLLLKGKLNSSGKRYGRRWFSWSPIYYNATDKKLMLSGLVDQLINNEIWMQTLKLEDRPLVMGQSGIIFLYPVR